MLLTETCYYLENQVFGGVNNLDMSRRASARDFMVVDMIISSIVGVGAGVKSNHQRI